MRFSETVLYNSSNSTALYFLPVGSYFGTTTAIMFIERYSETSCNSIHLNTTGRPSMFGEDTKRLMNNVFGYFDIEQFSFAHTVVNITAEVIVAPTSQYIWSRVAESSNLTGPQLQLVQPST